MKRTTLFLLLTTILCSGCSEDWLNTNSNGSATDATVFETTENARTAVNGMTLLMSYAYTYTTPTSASASWNGEGSIKLTYGNYMGTHTVVANKNAFGPLYKGTIYMSNASSVYDYYPWGYYYRLIGNANTLIAHIHEAKGAQSERDYILAQGLTFRAYSYFMLTQLYCARWSDEGAAESRGVVLRLDESEDPMPASTLGEVYQQIYTDLHQADSLFESSGEKHNTADYYTTNIYVANAVWARAALTRGDYDTAAEKAGKVRRAYELMSNGEYAKGFNEPNKEWIWGSYSAPDQTIGQYSLFAQMAYNRSYYLTAPTLISRKLYERIPATDIRRDLFLDPTGYAYVTSGNTLGLSPVGNDSALYKHAYASYPDMTGSVYAYMQFKFRCADEAGRGQGCLNHIRASEMYLIEAEAEARRGNDTEAAALLYMLVHDTGRDPAYVRSASTGNALLEEIKFYRAIELWGEGFDWFDMKRWGDTINREGYGAGGNFYGNLIFTINPADNNAWCWVFPKLETDYNGMTTGE